MRFSKLTGMQQHSCVLTIWDERNKMIFEGTRTEERRYLCFDNLASTSDNLASTSDNLGRKEQDDLRRDSNGGSSDEDRSQESHAARPDTREEVQLVPQTERQRAELETSEFRIEQSSEGRQNDY
ncbi:hypothetical protein R1sor_020337 [Riccia sorocarpa]|uniref:Uncharacterized protein n=1 Tax=Riccia sorocarpa TaxID=122646 RepID=A0ABD3IF14_9MARC